MAKETERKFLVRPGFEPPAVKKIRIRQSYFSIDPERTIRLRIIGRKAVITFKSSAAKGSFSRNEWEYEIPLEDAREMMKICLPGSIEKTRYYVPSGNHIFEVDVFHGRNEGLMIAEIELKSESEEFEKPVWLGEEVTGNPEYYNSNLIL
jgi:adenylate cyclase